MHIYGLNNSSSGITKIEETRIDPQIQKFQHWILRSNVQEYQHPHKSDFRTILAFKQTPGNKHLFLKIKTVLFQIILKCIPMHKKVSGILFWNKNHFPSPFS